MDNFWKNTIITDNHNNFSAYTCNNMPMKLEIWKHSESGIFLKFKTPQKSAELFRALAGKISVQSLY